MLTDLRDVCKPVGSKKQRDRRFVKTRGIAQPFADETADGAVGRLACEPDRMAGVRQSLSEERELRALAAAVDALEDDEASAHACTPPRLRCMASLIFAMFSLPISLAWALPWRMMSRTSSRWAS